MGLRTRGSGMGSRRLEDPWTVGLLPTRWREIRPGVNQGGEGRPVWAEFFQNRPAVAGLLGIGLVGAAVCLGPWILRTDPAFQGVFQGGDLSLRLAPPSIAHPLGTDVFGRDVLARLLQGGRISLGIGLAATLLGVGMGVVAGVVAGYTGGLLDSVVMRVADTLLAFPKLVLLVSLSALFGPSISLVIGTLALSQWPVGARLARGEVLALRQRPFVDAARALGFSRRRILLRHVLPNAMTPLLVVAPLSVGEAVVMEASLSFLGLGVQPPVASWGSMVAEGLSPLAEGAWWVSTFPGLALVLVVISFNLVSDGLRDALDPRWVGGRG